LIYLKKTPPCADIILHAEMKSYSKDTGYEIKFQIRQWKEFKPFYGKTIRRENIRTTIYEDSCMKNMMKRRDICGVRAMLEEGYDPDRQFSFNMYLHYIDIDVFFVVSPVIPGIC